MGTIPDLSNLIRQIEVAAGKIIGQDITTVSGFAKSQEIKFAKFAVWIAEADAAHEFDGVPELRADFLQSLQDMVKDFLNTLVGLAKLTIEKLWNSIVTILWDALDKATGLALPRPI